MGVEIRLALSEKDFNTTFLSKTSMKKFILLSAALFALVFTACNRDIIDPEENLRGDATVSVQVSGYTTTRALDTVPANIKVKKLRVILTNAAGNVVANKYAEDAAGVMEIEKIVVPIGTYTILAVANESVTDSAVLEDATTLSEIQAITSYNLDGEYANPLSVVLTGYLANVSLSKGANYLGYGANPAGASSGDNIITDDFVLYRLVSLIQLGQIDNNTGGRLAIDSIFVVNAKRTTQLFPLDLSDVKNRTDVKHNMSASPQSGEIVRDTTFAQGSLSNWTGGFRYPRFYGGGNAADSMKLVAEDLLALNDNLNEALNWNAGQGAANTDEAFYVYSNDGFDVTTNDSTATMLVIRGIWKDSPSSAGEVTYYPIVINKQEVNHNLTGTGLNQYVKRNSVYNITKVTITNKGHDNLWSSEVASLNVNMTVGGWDAIVEQEVNF